MDCILRLVIGCCLAAGTFWSCSALAADESPEIRAAVSSDEIFVGETIDLQVEIRNVENPPAPNLTDVRKAFDVESRGDFPRNQSSTLIVNGKITQESSFSHFFVYRLTPRSAGELSIPPVSVTIDGREMSTASIPVRVQDADKQDVVLAEIISDRPVVYPTQPFVVTVRVLVKPLPDSAANPLTPLRRRPPHLQVNWVDPIDGLSTGETSEWLQPLLAQNGAGFTLNDISAQTGGFFGGSQAAVFDLENGRESRPDLSGQERSWFVFTLSRTFTAEKIGRFRFGPALVKGTFVEGAQGNEYTARRIVALAPAIEVDVKDVPEPRPGDFTGGIGEFALNAVVTPTRVRVGDPVTLTLEFAKADKSSSLERISPPDLTAVPAISEAFEIMDREPVGRTDNDVKRFTYSLRPKRAGVSLPEISLTTFDPAGEQFASIKSQAVPLEVSEAIQLRGEELIGEVRGGVTSEMRRSDSGIFQNVTNLAEVYNQQIDIRGWLCTVAAGWVAAAGTILTVRIRRSQGTDPAEIRRQQARPAARNRIEQARLALEGGELQDAMKQLRSAITGMIGDYSNSCSESLTVSEVLALLKTARVAEDDQQAVLNMLQQIENAEYGGGSAPELHAILRTISEWVDRVGKQLDNWRTA